MNTTLTKTQLRALAWLSEDWARANTSVSSAVQSLHRYHRNLVEGRWGMFGSQGGYCLQYRLTELGAREKAMLAVAEGQEQ